MGINGERYLDRPEQWDELAARLRAVRTMGLDSEFYNVEVDEQSCVGRAVVHVWSVAIRTTRMDPLGFHCCRAWVLPADAATYPPLRAVLEDPTVQKEIHNEPVDHHAFGNMGVVIRGGRNTLGYLRWQMPHLINSPGRFKLKACLQTLMHTEPVCTFEELVSWERQEIVRTFKTRIIKRCSCGVPGCRKRKGHDKIEGPENYMTEKEVTVRGRFRLQDIVPGHERWPLLLEYATLDAVAALCFAELAEQQRDPAPWPYGGIGRPGFNQRIEEAVIAMEKVGLPVDVEFCRTMAERAMADEATELEWLYRWWVVNGPVEWGPHCRSRVDKVWSSPVQKVRMFDELGFPRSPVWRKGRVKKGKVKLDATALKWIGAECPEAKQLTDHLLQLQRIRSSLKYLVKLRDSGGIVHPICGPAGDEDDRAGAVTGRLGIKGEFEAQQMPTREEVDLYQLRRAIAA